MATSAVKLSEIIDVLAKESYVLHLMALVSEKEEVLSIAQKKFHEKGPVVIVTEDMMDLLIDDVLSAQTQLSEAFESMDDNDE